MTQKMASGEGKQLGSKRTAHLGSPAEKGTSWRSATSQSVTRSVIFGSVAKRKRRTDNRATKLVLLKGASNGSNPFTAPNRPGGTGEQQWTCEMSESLSLAEALPKEQARVREIIIMYRDPSLNGAGELAASLMEISLRKADVAVMSGDVVAMIAAYNDLRGYEL